MTEFLYAACGLSIAASRRLPGFRPASGVPLGQPIHVTPGQMPRGIALPSADVLFYASPVRSASGEPVLHAWTTPDRDHFYLVRDTGVRCWLDADANRVSLDWPDGREDDAYEFFRGLVLAFMLRLRGTLCLHAAVMAMGGQAVVIAGRPLAGKSTLAAALLARGHVFVTDDVAAVSWPDGRPYVEPGPCWIQPRSADGQSRAAGNAYARPIDVARDGRAQTSAAVPVGVIAFLEPDATRTGPPEIATVTPSAALIALLGDTWAARLQNHEMRAQEFADAARLVACTTLLSVCYAPNPDWAERVSDLLERRVSAGAPLGDAERTHPNPRHGRFESTPV